MASKRARDKHKKKQQGNKERIVIWNKNKNDKPRMVLLEYKVIKVEYHLQVYTHYSYGNNLPGLESQMADDSFN